MEVYLTYYFWLLDLGKIHMRTGEMDAAEKCHETVVEYLKKDKRAVRYFTETFTRTELDKYRLELLVKEQRFPEAEALVQKMQKQKNRKSRRARWARRLQIRSEK